MTMPSSTWLVPAFFLGIIACGELIGDDHSLHRFDRIQLTGTYFSEGANFGDINNDGINDIVYGPYWFAGPDYKQKKEIYTVVPQPMERYADNFFAWVYDFDDDGWNDVFVVGFPGTPAHVYQNPGKEGHSSHWKKHEVMDWVSNESPQFTNLIGDEHPELICTRDGIFGYATPNWQKPFEPWTFQRISPQVATKRFGHGLGIGDVDGDSRFDIIVKNGWFEQPDDKAAARLWSFHPVEFAIAGGADMFAYDVDGDGDNDVITSLDAHNYGLAWHEQIRDGDRVSFRRHLIMGNKASDNKYGILFTEPHSINLIDIDGDGLKDICTGKTYWSHHKQSPMWDAGAVVYWFKLSRTDQGVDWIPYKADGEAGIGRQLIVGDVNGDKLLDMVVGGMKGCHVLIHRKVAVDLETWQAAQPQVAKSMATGLSPQAAAKQMSVPPGFHVQLAAGEPLLHQPIGFALDHRGRVWVAEAYTYPVRAPDGEGIDKIIILEDTDQDGTLDSRKEFATGLNLVSGIEVGFGGVWVGAAPYLMFIPDKDGDDVPDSEPQILLDGFGYQDTHETLNGFIWGPDGWLYGCHGVFTHSKIGKPGTADEERTPMNAAVWRYHPTRHEFDVFAQGTSNPWGVDFNDRGHAFITACVIPHLFHVIQGARYQRQAGQHFEPHTYDDIKTIADHLHYSGRIQDSAWWGHEPKLSHTVSQAGGGHAHCGAMIYLGDNWPDHYRDSIYMNNIHGNRVNNDILERHGSGYIGRHGQDLLMANDHWYRGINLKYGPNGSVLFIDWYDKHACHRSTPEIWDRSSGRIYRLAYGDVKPETVDLSKLSHEALAKLHLHKNDWYVRTARRILQERAAAGDVADARTALAEILRTNQDVTRRLRALWTLHVTGGVETEQLLLALEDVDENMRGWAIQLLLEDRDPSSQTIDKFAEMARDDSSKLVRLYLASGLQRIRLAERWTIAANLLAQATDADDHNLPLMIWYGVEPLVTSDAGRAMRLADGANMPLVRRFIIRRAASENDTLGQVVGLLPGCKDAQRHLILDETLKAFEGRVDIPMPESWRAAYNDLLKSEDEKIRTKADQVAVILGDKRILPRMRALLADSSMAIEIRQKALDIVNRGRDPEAAPALIAALAEPVLRSKAIRLLAAYEHEEIPIQLINQYGRFDEQQRQDAISTLTARPAYAVALLDAIEKGTVPRIDVRAYAIRQLRSFNDEKLMQRIKSVWGAVRESSADKKQRIADLKSQLAEDHLENADLRHGRAVFNKTCAACHKLFGAGDAIGPDITGSNRANLDYILENGVDPSAVVSKDYQMTIFTLYDGRVVTGLVQKETDSAVTVRLVNDTMVIAKNDIEERMLSRSSLMPEGQFDQLGRDELRDLIAYLASPSQIGLPHVAAPIDAATGSVPGAIEAESMKVVGKTKGNITAQGMGSFGDQWSGKKQLWWTGASVDAELALEFDVPKDNTYRVEVVMTKARDYGIVQLSIDDRKLGSPIDLFNIPNVITTGVLHFDQQSLTKGSHRLAIQIKGTHPKAVKAYMFGLDYLRLVPSEQVELPTNQDDVVHASASKCFSGDTVAALHDGVIPSSPGTEGVPRMTWYDHKGTKEWVHYRFDEPRTISKASVYWFDDRANNGGCRIPESWRLVYRDGVDWKPVSGIKSYGVKRDQFNPITFDPISTTEIRLEAQLQNGFSSGIYEWTVATN